MSYGERHTIRDLFPLLALAVAAELYSKRETIKPIIEEKFARMPKLDASKFAIAHKSPDFKSLAKQMTKDAVMSYVKNNVLDEAHKEHFTNEFQNIKSKFLDVMSGGCCCGSNIPTNIYEKGKDVFVEMEAPGVTKADIDVQASEQSLLVEINVKLDETISEESYFLCERQTGKISRNFDLPIPVVPEKAKAEFKEGILRITIPKAESAIKKAIKVD